MTRWEYAQLVARRHFDDDIRDFRVRYFTVEGPRIETPEKVTKGLMTKKQVLPPDKECWQWFHHKIAELGKEGWEMISAPNSEIVGTSSTSEWLLWFKRPIT